ncbi:DsrE/DsrF/DrsH-like family protein [Helicovermis profundi]|uniref:CoA-disulfide reductase n=1 Tax=Helicovermis profundi TaxID=3065157 RepID=A0AAU9EE63_9FIRM|nr:CoA-disulfide reductase [Clostridia bacterium S502]
MAKKVLIVGGVAGGAGTAARLRRMDETAEIIMFERGEYISFANCGLPYYIGETIEERDALLVQTPEAMEARFNIDVRVQNEVLSIDKENKILEVKNLKTDVTYKESYDVLVLSPGSTPLKPPIPGINASNIFTLWNIPDTDIIKEYVDRKKPKKAVVIGGGFIGIEMAENLHDRGIEVSVVEMVNQVMAPIDFEMAEIVHNHLRQKGINLILGDGVKQFTNEKGLTAVELQSGLKLDTDMVMLSIGVRPQSNLAKEAGLELNQRGGIVVDEYLKTSDENIFALGDVIEVIDFVNGGKAMIPLAGPANKQGRIVANNISGEMEKYKGTQGTSIAKVFDLTVANTGVNEKNLIRMGKKIREDYDVVILHLKSHAGYYPGAIPLTLKLVFAMDGKVLGAQIVGYDGVDKRIDVIATAIRFNATVDDLKELELAYAPPYSSAKDPVNMAGFTANNMLTKKFKSINYNELEDIDFDKDIILDVREDIERELGFIKGSINISVDELRNRYKELDKSKRIITYCAIGLRGYIAARILENLGFENVWNLSGGYSTYASVYCHDEDSEYCENVSCEEGYCPDTDFSETGDVENKKTVRTGEVVKLNACGLSCPGPIMKVYKAIEAMNDGDVLDVKASDPGFANDIATWTRRTGNTLLSSGKEDKNYIASIMKGIEGRVEKEPVKTQIVNPNDGKTMVVFSGDLDKALASLIIANGAASMGREVTMFFTFWGLNILRKNNKVSVKKDLVSSMFGAMMPRGTKKLKLSKMSMLGMGGKMIRKVMKNKNIDSLEELLQSALDNGVKMIACNMSMDIMGITEEELIDGIDLGGVATYLGAAEESNVNLFI